MPSSSSLLQPPLTLESQLKKSVEANQLSPARSLRALGTDDQDKLIRVEDEGRPGHIEVSGSREMS